MGSDHADYQIPLFTNLPGIDQLNIQRVLVACIGADLEICIVLKGTLIRLATGFWVCF
jgi:hypothetical protein